MKIENMLVASKDLAVSPCYLNLLAWNDYLILDLKPSMVVELSLLSTKSFTCKLNPINHLVMVILLTLFYVPR